MDLSSLKPRTVQVSRSKCNLKILENCGLNERTGFWWLKFTFDYGLEEGIVVRLLNFKYSRSSDWTLEITKCSYLGITSEENMASFDMVDEFVNTTELLRLNDSVVSSEKLVDYLETNVVPLVTRKIKYTKFKPQFRFFLSYKTKDKPLMRTFQNGLCFIGYDTWLDTSHMPLGANLLLALKTSIDECDCLIAWLTEDYLTSQYCMAELVYAKKAGKIILPFGSYAGIKDHFKGDLEFLQQHVVYDPNESSFFEVLRRIDDSLFSFEKLPI